MAKSFGRRFIGYAILCICGCSQIMALNSHCHKLCYQLKNESISHLHKLKIQFRFDEQSTQHVAWLALCTVSSEAVWCASSSVPGRRVWRHLPPQTVSEISGASCRQHTGIHVHVRAYYPLHVWIKPATYLSNLRETAVPCNLCQLPCRLLMVSLWREPKTFVTQWPTSPLWPEPCSNTTL